MNLDITRSDKKISQSVQCHVKRNCHLFTTEGKGLVLIGMNAACGQMSDVMFWDIARKRLAGFIRKPYRISVLKESTRKVV